eukprot:3894832-Amphidinium_carterae.1
MQSTRLALVQGWQHRFDCLVGRPEAHAKQRAVLTEPCQTASASSIYHPSLRIKSLSDIR